MGARPSPDGAGQGWSGGGTIRPSATIRGGCLRMVGIRRRGCGRSSLSADGSKKWRRTAILHPPIRPSATIRGFIRGSSNSLLYRAFPARRNDPPIRNREGHMRLRMLPPCGSVKGGRGSARPAAAGAGTRGAFHRRVHRTGSLAGRRRCRIAVAVSGCGSRLAASVLRTSGPCERMPLSWHRSTISSASSLRSTSTQT